MKENICKWLSANRFEISISSISIFQYSAKAEIRFESLFPTVKVENCNKELKTESLTAFGNGSYTSKTCFAVGAFRSILRNNILAEFQLTQAIVCAHKLKKLHYETWSNIRDN